MANQPLSQEEVRQLLETINSGLGTIGSTVNNSIQSILGTLNVGSLSSNLNVQNMMPTFDTSQEGRLKVNMNGSQLLDLNLTDLINRANSQ
ncbi:hypothetical protein ACFSCX_02100 [Bacillus salitolerans]|uniref:Uncharacterized protein n=1 Tax=Bacillus salitolerans TaxID=1437434 RepID=A0ABW4LJF6_9BACI